MNSGIYVIENVINHKRYIGSSVDLTRRKTNHFKTLRLGTHRNSHLQRAFLKYGEPSFSFKTILICEPSELLHYEQTLIDRWKPEYNIYKIAGSPLGNKLSEETKQRQRNAHLGMKYKPMSEKGKLNLSIAHKGQRPSESNKQSRIRAITGCPRSEETKQKIREANIGHHPSDETRRKMGESARKYWSAKDTAV